MKQLTFLIALIFSTVLFAQKNSELAKVPKQYSIEAGYRNVFSVIDNSNVLGGNAASNGYGVLFDYAWQLSGLNGKKPAAYLSVPMGYSVMMPDNDQSKSISMLNYGWTVRHELSTHQTIVPFVGYGLLLNTLKIREREGSVMGHQTQFEFGVNLNTKTRLKYFAKAEYSYTSYPRLEDAKRIHYQFLDLRVGVRF